MLFDRLVLSKAHIAHFPFVCCPVSPNDFHKADAAALKQ